MSQKNFEVSKGTVIEIRGELRFNGIIQACYWTCTSMPWIRNASVLCRPVLSLFIQKPVAHMITPEQFHSNHLVKLASFGKSLVSFD